MIRSLSKLLILIVLTFTIPIFAYAFSGELEQIGLPTWVTALSSLGMTSVFFLWVIWPKSGAYSQWLDRQDKWHAERSTQLSNMHNDQRGDAQRIYDQLNRLASDYDTLPCRREDDRK